MKILKIFFYILVIIFIYNHYEEFYSFVCDFFTHIYTKIVGVKEVPLPDLPKEEISVFIEKEVGKSYFSKKQIVISCVVVGSLICITGVGVCFIPGVPETVIGIVVGATVSCGFGGA